MSNMKDKTFADGFLFSKNPQAPEFVVGKLSLVVDDAVKFLREHTDSKGWVNLDIKQSKAGKYYLELNTWKPEVDKTPVAAKAQVEDDLPF